MQCPSYLTAKSARLISMERIGDLLQRYSPKGPDDVMAVKRYIAQEFDTQVSVGVQGSDSLVITVPSASLANTLRFRVAAIQAAAGTTKRLIFRIG
jgi:hypothetical protein